MSYATPVFLENSLKDPFLVGIILSISSFFGIFFDFFVSKWFGGKSYKFFIFWTLAIAGFFPLSFLLLPKISIAFVFSMIVWSAYYEMRGYSKYNFVHNFAETKNHIKAFSITNTAQWLAYMLGPLLAVYLIGKSDNIALQACLIIIAIAVWIYFVFSRVASKPGRKLQSEYKNKSAKAELKIFSLLFKTTAPLVAFNIVLVLLDVTFWSTGILFAEELRKGSQAGGFFMTTYGLPALFVGLIAPKLPKRFGKKRISYALGILAGISLTLIGTFSNVLVILTATFIAAVFSSIVFILMDSVFEDYVARLKTEGNDIVSVNQIATNFAYAVGPIMLGYISKEFNYGATFIFSGVLLVVISIIAFVFTPRKIKMPHRIINSILDTN
jgi:predicted MFS family arabinose efflux permease